MSEYYYEFYRQSWAGEWQCDDDGNKVNGRKLTYKDWSGLRIPRYADAAREINWRWIINKFLYSLAGLDIWTKLLIQGTIYKLEIWIICLGSNTYSTYLIAYIL